MPCSNALVGAKPPTRTINPLRRLSGTSPKYDTNILIFKER